jgi:hypothetical protein
LWPSFETLARRAREFLAQDRRGALVNNARRMRGGASITDAQASAGF